METVYDAAGGWDGMLRLAAAWHEHALADDVVAHAFNHGFREDHVERLAAYWAEALGGPPLYTERGGTETHAVRLHSGNGEHDEMNRRAIACFEQALTDVGFSAAEPVYRTLLVYWTWATTTVMATYHESADEVPDGLTISHWSWDGPASTAAAAH